MILKNMIRTITTANKLVDFLLISNVVLSVCLAMAVGKLVSSHEVTRIVPPGLDRPVSVGWDTADEDYLESVGLYVADLAGNVTPGNAKFVADSLSQIMTPRIYQSARAQILALADDPVFKNSGGSMRFEARKIVPERQTQKIFVIGQMTSQQIGSRDVRPMVIEMKLIMKNGRPWVDGFDHYTGSDAHTLEWIDKNPTRSQQVEQQLQASAAEVTSDAEATLARAGQNPSEQDVAQPVAAQQPALPMPVPVPTVPSTSTQPAATPPSDSAYLPPAATTQPVTEKKQ
jgi:conjugal transfer pilus assembly protein TraE